MFSLSMSASTAAAAGFKVASIDCLPYGGTCVLRGRDPKKMLIAVSEGMDWADMIAFKQTFTDTNTIESDGEILRARHFQIATGARPRTLNIPGEQFLLTSTDFLSIAEKPERIAFVGGGFIAMEFAHISMRSGATEVTVLEMMKRPLGNFDPDLVSILVEAA